jgi:hypothetical protein
VSAPLIAGFGVVDERRPFKVAKNQVVEAFNMVPDLVRDGPAAHGRIDEPIGQDDAGVPRTDHQLRGRAVERESELIVARLPCWPNSAAFSVQRHGR